MPLRRRSPELSPRLRALLGVEDDPLEGGAAVRPRTPRGSGPPDRPGPPGRDRPGTTTVPRPVVRSPDVDHDEDGWWTPSRAWLEQVGVRTTGEYAAGPPATGTASTPPEHDDTSPRPRGRHRAPGPPRVLTLPSALVGARVTGSGRAALGLVLVGVVAAVVLGGRVLLARADAQPQVLPRSGGATPVSMVDRASGATAAAGTAPTASVTVAPGTVVVHVVGKVARPGLVTLPAGSRVSEAVRAAGGAAKGADLSGLNLARLLVDGEQLRVPAPGEQVAAPAGPGASGGAASGLGASGATGGAVTPVDLNSADLTALDGLPGVGPVLAQRILDWRTQNGRFTSIDELGEVSGIGEKVLARLQPLVRV